MKKLLFLYVFILLLNACGRNNNDKAAAIKKGVGTEWQKITSEDIEGNAIKLFSQDWMVLSAGKKDSMNMMTIAWGGLGELWSKPVVTVYVMTTRYTNQFMENNDYFTVTAFPEEYREKLQYLGTVSGRDEDKLKGAGLTAEFTELGNPIYKEASLAIECRKLYARPMDKSLMPLEQRQWYDEKGDGAVHVAYIGEIVNVWKK